MSTETLGWSCRKAAWDSAQPGALLGSYFQQNCPTEESKPPEVPEIFPTRDHYQHCQQRKQINKAGRSLPERPPAKLELFSRSLGWQDGSAGKGACRQDR